ncbi:MAG TPA: NUDIX hydrolase [Thermomicrobiales bacterium]|nr:NUDIX hydrolase [Thermomicrobiales bacterium]
MVLVFVNVESAVYHDGRYLMIVRGEEEDHAAGMLAFPGGGLDYVEMPDILEQTAVREIFEETGVSVDDVQFVEAHSFTAPDGTPVVDVVFLSRYDAGTPLITDPGEVAALRWMTAAEILADHACPPWMSPSLALVERKRQALGW